MIKIATIAILALLAPRTVDAARLIMTPPGVEVENSNRVADLSGAIMPKLAAQFAKLMDETADKPGARIIIITSPGGSVEDGEKILEAINKDRAAGHKIVCVAVGEATSMAFNILTRCDRRYAVAGSVMLVHKIRAGAVFYATAVLLRRIADNLDAMDEPYRQANAKAMSLSLAEYDKYADAETVWTAEQLLKRGYLHGIVILEK